MLIGSPGAGKTTQGNLLSSQTGMPLITTGDLVRQAMSEDSTKGQQLREIYGKGQLIPDLLMLGLLKDVIGSAPEGIILDGFPRTLAQAEALSSVLPVVQRVLELDVPSTLAQSRLMARQRDEADAPHVIYARMIEYIRESSLVADYYLKRKMLNFVYAVGTVEEVNESLHKALVLRVHVSRTIVDDMHADEPTEINVS